MKTHFKQTFRNAKESFLASAVYDVSKSIFLTLVGFLVLKMFPKETSVGEFVNRKISITILQGCLIICLSIAITMIVYFLVHRKRFALIKKDLQTDELTGIPNHRALSQDLPKTIEWAKTENKPFSVILMDIDDFKKLNNDFSQTVADRVLLKFGTLLQSDRRLTDSLYRQHVKGDEFIIITKETILENAIKAANRKRETIAATGIQIEGYETPFRITVCCGVVEFNFREDNEQSILERAFDAMKQAKIKVNKNSTISLV